MAQYFVRDEKAKSAVVVDEAVKVVEKKVEPAKVVKPRGFKRKVSKR